MKSKINKIFRTAVQGRFLGLLRFWGCVVRGSWCSLHTFLCFVEWTQHLPASPTTANMLAHVPKLRVQQQATPRFSPASSTTSNRATIFRQKSRNTTFNHISYLVHTPWSLQHVKANNHNIRCFSTAKQDAELNLKEIEEEGRCWITVCLHLIYSYNVLQLWKKWRRPSDLNCYQQKVAHHSKLPHPRTHHRTK